MARDDYRPEGPLLRRSGPAGDAAKSVAECGNSISHERAAQIVGKVGTDVRRELFGPDAQVAARGEAPANPPELLVIQPDGSRYRTNEADARRKHAGPAGDTSEAGAADRPAEPESARGPAFGELAPRERDRGWPAGPDRTGGADPPGGRTRSAS